MVLRKAIEKIYSCFMQLTKAGRGAINHCISCNGLQLSPVVRSQAVNYL
jgi:hypothetical protein